MLLPWLRAFQSSTDLLITSLTFRHLRFLGNCFPDILGMYLAGRVNSSASKKKKNKKTCSVELNTAFYSLKPSTVCMTPALCPWSWLQGVRHALGPRDHKRKVESSEHRATVILNSIYRVKGLYKITASREISKWCLETKQSIRRLRCITVYWRMSMYRVSCSPIRFEHWWQENIEFNDQQLLRWSNVLLGNPDQ